MVQDFRHTYVDDQCLINCIERERVLANVTLKNSCRKTLNAKLCNARYIITSIRNLFYDVSINYASSVITN